MLRRSSNTRLIWANSRSIVRLNSSRYSASSCIFSDEPAVVLDVLERMRQIVHEACGHAAEHRVALLLPDVLLQLAQAVRHAVERVAEPARARRSTSTWTRSSRRPSAMASVPRMSAVMGRMSERPQTRPASSMTSSARLMAAMRPRSWRRAVANASRVGCSTSTIQSRSGTRTPTDEHPLAARACALAAPRGVPGAADRKADHDRVGGEAHAVRHFRALLRVAVRQQVAARPDHDGVAGGAHADAADQPPQLLDAELADEPPGLPLGAAKGRGHERGGQQVVVDEHRRHARAVHARRHRRGGSLTVGAPMRLVATAAPPRRRPSARGTPGSAAT